MNYIKVLWVKSIAAFVMSSTSLFFQIHFTSTTAYADLQSILEGQFDIVERFDNLSDWTGTGSGNVFVPNDMPKMLDGSSSMWQHYSFYGDSYDKNWIGNHGVGNVWMGTGKSLHLDYNCTQGQDNDYGPSRLSFKIGDSPDDGYPNEVHVFFMTKLSKDFFKTTNNTFDYHGFLKTLVISAGFKNIDYFGTDEEHDYLLSCGAKSQSYRGYGLNAQVYNYKTYGGGTTNQAVKITALTPNVDASGCGYGGEVIDLTSVDMGGFILANSWFGIEYRVKMSKPHGTTSGEFEVWIYDSLGNIAAHQLKTGVVNFRDGNTVFNHAWNKFDWGGNRQCPPTYREEFGPEDDLYIDDIVIHGSRIGPNYFALLQGNPPPKDSISPKAPEGLSLP